MKTKLVRPKPDLVVCPVCGGDGWEDERRYLGCYRCHGIGWVVQARKRR